MGWGLGLRFFPPGLTVRLRIWPLVAAAVEAKSRLTGEEERLHRPPRKLPWQQGSGHLLIEQALRSSRGSFALGWRRDGSQPTVFLPLG